MKNVSRKFCQSVFSPAVVCEVASLKQGCIPFLAGKVVVQIALDSFGDDSALSVYRLYRIGYAVLLKYVLKSQGDFSVPCKRYGVYRLVLPQKAYRLFGRNVSSPPVNKQGKPKVMTSSFKGLLPIRHKYPRSARVLNIYGNYGDGSDGDVYVNSAKTLKYLVSGRAKSYQERLITGKQAQHSRLHENKQVDRILIKFLWNK